MVAHHELHGLTEIPVDQAHVLSGLVKLPRATLTDSSAALFF